MKFTAVSALLISSVAAFAPVQQPAFARSTTSLQAEHATSRSAFFVQLAGIAAATTVLPGVANAAKYGGFGAGSPGVLDPKDSIIDDEILASAAVQKALKDVQGYADMVAQMKSGLASNSQANLGPVIRKEFDFGKLRSDLNTLNTAFDEDTQRGTDRLIRGILQDLTELEQANAQKEGIERSERRVATLNGKLNKLQNTFNDFLAFAK